MNTLDASPASSFHPVEETKTALTEFHRNFSLAYPHAQGFADGGSSLVLGQMLDGEARIVKRSLSSGAEDVLMVRPQSEQPEGRLWFEVALDTNALVTVAGNGVWLLEIGNPSPARLLFQAPADAEIHSIPAITRDGSKVAFSLRRGREWTVCLVYPENNLVDEAATFPWFANHIHFCPHDENWLGFSHEGPAASVSDRVWAWHREKSPHGHCVFDQFASEPSRHLLAGHEQWCHHDLSATVVAYGEGPGKPRGIYEAFANGRPQRLISEGDRDWHVQTSRDGQWSVVDTSGPSDRPGAGWENADGISDIVLIERATGKRTFLARSRIGAHHIHPHPVFSPDGRWIYFNEANSEGELSRVNRVAHPFYDR